MENKNAYPELNEEGIREAQKLIEGFKSKMKEESDKVIMDLYCEVMPYLETDAWSNFHQAILNDICDYGNSKTRPHDYSKIRQAIYKEHKKEIVKDLNQDLVKKVEELEAEKLRLTTKLNFR